ncbi:hypothetical protein TNCV_2699621 [Trichonephila clavipes]|nr:hypothetical protein TNCV_2699621 [Trichonephila clavipes]
MGSTTNATEDWSYGWVMLFGTILAEAMVAEWSWSRPRSQRCRVASSKLRATNDPSCGGVDICKISVDTQSVDV